LHLGVTEAGLGEDGRIKSAVGIGALLDDGLGDTIRVSLTEEPEEEVPVAQHLVAPYNAGLRAARSFADVAERVDPYSYARRLSDSVDVGGLDVGDGATVAVLDPREAALTVDPDLTSVTRLDAPVPWFDAVRAYRTLAASSGDRPLHLQVGVDGDELEVLLRASTVLGSLLCDGIGDSVGLSAPMTDE